MEVQAVSLLLSHAWLFLFLTLHYLLYKSINITFSCRTQDTAVYHLSYSHDILSFLWKTIMSSIKDLLTKVNRSKNLTGHNAAKCFLYTWIIWFRLPLVSKLCWKMSCLSSLLLFVCVPTHCSFNLEVSFTPPSPHHLLHLHLQQLLFYLLVAVSIIVLLWSVCKYLFSLFSYQGG